MTTPPKEITPARHLGGSGWESAVERLDRAIAAYARADYFASHELLEEAWLASGTPRSLELHALAQLAAGMHKHATQRKPTAARSILGRARDKLVRLSASEHAVDLDALRASLDAFLVGDTSSVPTMRRSR